MEGIKKYKERIEKYRNDLERYDVILNYYLGTESDNIKGIPELSINVLRGRNKFYLCKTIEETKKIISKNTSNSLFQLNKILEISKKSNKIESGLTKLMLMDFGN